MLRLLPDHPGVQTFYLTLQESARDYTYTHYLFRFTNRLSGAAFVFIADVAFDNPRYTAVDIRTDTSDTNNVQLTATGYYDYEVWVQDSAINLSPEAAIAKVEQGLLYVIGEDISTTPAIASSTNFVYYG